MWNDKTHPVGTELVAKSAHYAGVELGARTHIAHWCDLGCCMYIEGKDRVRIWAEPADAHNYLDIYAPKPSFTISHAGALLALVGAASVASHKLKQRKQKQALVPHAHR